MSLKQPTDQPTDRPTDCMAQFAFRTAYSHSDSGNSQLCMNPKFILLSHLFPLGLYFVCLLCHLEIFGLHQKLGDASKQIKRNEGLIIKIIKQFTSNTPYLFIMWEATCFGPYRAIIRPSYESSRYAAYMLGSQLCLH
jgi:hypothetical protein